MEANRTRQMVAIAVALSSLSVLVRADDTLSGVVSDAFGKIHTAQNVTLTHI